MYGTYKWYDSMRLKSSLDQEIRTFHVGVEVHISHLFFDGFEGHELSNACIDKHGGDHQTLLLEQCGQLDPICDAPSIVSHSDDLLAE